MRGFDRDVLRRQARNLLSKISTKDADRFGGKEEFGYLIEVLRCLAEQHDMDLAEREVLRQEQLPPVESTTNSGRGYAVKSTDPRKRPVMEEIKRRTGANKVTTVRETATHFVGCPMKGGKGRSKYEALPECWVPKADLNLCD